MAEEIKDTYLTINGKAEGVYKDKGSKFLAFVHEVETTEGAMVIVAEYKKKYHDARHVCFAYVVGTEGEAQTRISDDGEPSGTAGKPMIGVLISKGLRNVVAIVVRYFGGVLLGTGGLVVAYRSAIDDALNSAEIVERLIEEKVELKFGYEDMDKVMRALRGCEARVVSREFEMECRMTVAVKKGHAGKLRKILGIRD